MISDAVIAWVRTVVPVLVGSAVAWLASVGIVVGEDASAGAIVAVTGVTIAGYYTLARLLARKWPRLEVLLGSTKQPTYDGTKVPS